MFNIYNYSFLKDNERIYWNLLLKIEYPLNWLYPLGAVFLFITCQNLTFHKLTNRLKSTLVTSTLKWVSGLILQ